MALNPFFLQGSPGEQRLVQDLINEQLTIFGVEVTYIPRKFVRKQTIIEEIQSSKFDDNFLIEAYVNTYEGHSGAGDILTKFGMSLRDEVTLTISQERFDDFISPFLEAMPDDEIEVPSRPREGDLVYFPLGSRLFEVKFVEHEQPFYQLGKNYVYELKCELFEYEDEILDTSIDEIDQVLEETGYITTLNLLSLGRRATATAQLSDTTGYISQIFLNNDGSGYTSTPTVAISTSPQGSVYNASAVAITTNRAGVYSVERIVLTNAGSGYTVAPTINIIGGGGTGAAATCSIETTYRGIVSVTVTDNGVGYAGTTPSITVEHPGDRATASGTIGTGGTVTSLSITNPGIGYTLAPPVTVSNPPTRSGVISESTLYSAGSGYSLGQYTISPYSGVVGVGGSQAVIEITSINGSGGITGFTTTYGGHSYESNDYYRLNGGNNLGIIRIRTTTTGIGITATVDATISGGGVVDSLTITNPGSGYTVAPTITIDNSDSVKDTSRIRAIFETVVDSDTEVSSVRITNPGIGYTEVPTLTISAPPITVGVGTYYYNEVVRGLTSKTEARVKSWDKDTNILKVSIVGIGTTVSGFTPGEILVGTAYSVSAASTSPGYASYAIKSYDERDIYDTYDTNDEIEEEADNILDFTESNPFGNY